MMRQFLLVAILSLSLVTAAPMPKMTVYKTATCGCCGKWVEHMKAAGFAVDVMVVPATAEYRQKNGIPDRFGSCHTATVGPYTFEGHIPAADIQRFLKEKPQARGLAVPGMPMGSPGMEGPRPQAYETLLIGLDGSAKTYAKH
jgi:hypothetical protein